MFCDSHNLEKVNFGNIDTSSVTNMVQLFSGCSSLKSLDLSNLVLSSVNNMYLMFNWCTNLETIYFGNTNVASPTILQETFRQCDKLVSLDLSHWDFSNVNTMELMFFSCDNLENVKFGSVNTPSPSINMEKLFQQSPKIKSVDFSSLGNSKVLKLDYMFEGCPSLETVNFGNLDTSEVDNFNGFFCGCTSLVMMELNNFVTSSVTTMEYMFKDCVNLKSLDLSTFDTTKVVSMSHMFYNCNSLVFLNLKSFLKDSLTNIENIFSELSDDIKFCINDVTTRNYLFSSYSGKNSICGDNCFNIENPKIDMTTKQCLNDCSESEDNKYEYFNGCYNKCPQGTLLDDFHCSNNECKGKPDSDTCKDETPVGYYYDTNDQIYKKCYEKCNYCNGEGTEANNNCIECKDNLILLNDNFNIKNCFLDCPHYYYFDELNVHHCTENNECPAEYSKLIEEKGLCIYQELIQTTNNLISTEMSEVNTFNLDQYGCIRDPLTMTCSMEETKDNNEIYDVLVNNILSTYDGGNGKSIVLEGHNNTVFQITNTKNELELLLNNNISDNYSLSIIDLSECEKKLKEEYHIAEEDSLIFIKQEKLTDKETEKNIQYECYEPYNKTKLNLSICSGININLYVPLSLSEETKNMAEQIKELGYNMFDINDKFYQDICSPYKSSVDSDVLLTDRIDYIYNNEDSQCQGNCEFTNYALNSRYINCTCPSELDTSNEEEKEKIDKFEAKSVYEMFYNVLKYSNYEVFKCYKLVFSKKVLTKNLGSIIILILFILYLACLLLYIIKGINPLKNIAGEFILEKEEKINLFFPPTRTKKSVIINSTNEESKKKLSKYRNKKTKNKNKERNTKAQNEIVIFDKNNEIKRSDSKSYLDKNGLIPFHNKETIIKDTNNKPKENKNQNELIEGNEEQNQEKKLDDFELNELSYQEAIEKDKRNFFQIYFSLIKREHRIVFSFFYFYDYNLIYVKLSRFIFLFATDMALNVFFFSDASMHKIYINYGKYDFLQQIPQIIYSTIVSQLIEVFLCFLSLTDKHIYQIKHLEKNFQNIKIINAIFKCIKIKLIVYFVFTFIFFGIYWYIVAAFCAVYENTQKAFIKDSLMSYLLSLIYPFILYLIPSSLRLTAIKCIKVKLEWVYKLSEIIPFF